MAGNELNKRQVETLIKAGAFDSLGVYRSRLLASYEKMLDGLASRNRSNLDGQLDMFSAVAQNTQSIASSYDYPMIAEFPMRELLMQEKEASGMYFSGHILDGYSKNISAVKHTPLSDFAKDENGDTAFSDRQKVTVVGVVTSISAKTTKKEERMAFFTLEDKYSSIDCIAFPSQYARCSSEIRVDNAVIIEGNVTFRDEDELQIIVSAVKPLTENTLYIESARTDEIKNEGVKAKAAPAPQKPKRLYLRVPARESREFVKAVNLIDIFEGATQVVFYAMDEKSYFSYSRPIYASEFVVNELCELLGRENVILK
jgi:DNA polymerase-3 subunit alpha